MGLLLAAASPSPWRWVPHPEVWVLVGGLSLLYLYAVRVIGPKVVPTGESAVSRAQVAWFVSGLGLLWIVTDWPIHDIGENYLFLVHMIQHLVLTLVVPGALLLAMPEWLARLLLGTGRVDRWVHQLARPVPATVLFNGLVVLTHWQTVVNTSADNGLFHYGVHTALVLSALLFWIPVCGPLPELRVSLPTRMVYLFVTSIIPTVPGAWLTFAEGPIYSAYEVRTRLFGISVVSDQQAAGLIMKLGGAAWLWTLITITFFQWSSRHERAQAAGVPASERDLLTWEAVRAEFDRHPAPAEVQRPGERA